MSPSIKQKGVISEIEVQQERTLRAVLEELEVDPSDYIVLVNDQKADLDAKITPKDRVLVLPKVRGGAH